ncbi:MAG TPA: hypothetical protein VLA76_03765 [Candidatus Angelobacter sp.]|nr:hypothetical protein [Candidatus Angelobacter sp.]
MSPGPLFGTFRRPVRREGAESYLFLVLVSFAVTVIGTRWFLELTGFPRIGGGDLHIAHALWGGAALFAAAVLPIVMAGRFVYRAASVLAGAGIGLFIDEVGKFITADNDYFFPAAAPIIYATFLLAVIAWLRVRRPPEADPRAQLLGALELLEESVEGDLQRAEVDALCERLRSAAAHAPAAEQRRLAAHLLAFVDAEELRVAPDPADRFGGLRAGWRARTDAWLGGRGLRATIVLALLLTGVVQVWALVSILAGLRLDPADPFDTLGRFQLLHLVVEAVAGALVVAGGVLVAIDGRHRLGWTLAYLGLLVTITLGDLIGFYVRQFDSILVVLGHLVLLAAVVRYRDELRAEAG